MKIRFLRSRYYVGVGDRAVDDVTEVPDDMARNFIGQGFARPMISPNKKKENNREEDES